MPRAQVNTRIEGGPQMNSVGIDLHRRRSEIAVVDGDGLGRTFALRFTYRMAHVGWPYPTRTPRAAPRRGLPSLGGPRGSTRPQLVVALARRMAL
jgi:hypothetical protein